MTTTVPKHPKDDPDPVWANVINLSGLASRAPIPVKWDASTKGYWDRTGNIVIDGLGELNKPGIITYASKSKESVEAWTKGARAVLTMLQRWAKAG